MALLQDRETLAMLHWAMLRGGRRSVRAAARQRRVALQSDGSTAAVGAPAIAQPALSGPA